MKEYPLLPEDREGRKVFETLLRGFRPDFRWGEMLGGAEVQLLIILQPNRIVLKITREALHQAADDADTHLDLELELKRQLAIAEGGFGDGVIREV